MDVDALTRIDERGDQSLRVALITPFSWIRPSAVNQHIADLACELLRRGHRPLILASTDDPGELRRTRDLARHHFQSGLALLAQWHSGELPDARLLPTRDSGPLQAEHGVPVLALGRSFAFRLNGSVTSIGLPVDILSRLERLLVAGGFDVVHVHEPLAPSLSFTAIRESRCPVVASFHLTPAALAAYELGSGVLSRFFDLLDERIVTSSLAVDVLAGLFGGTYRVIPPGTAIEARRSLGAPVDVVGGSAPRTAVYVYRGDDQRGLRALMRTLKASFPPDMDRFLVAVHGPSAELWPPNPAPKSLRGRVDWVDFDRAAELAPIYARASVAVVPFLGGEWLLQTASEALATGCPVVGPDLPVFRELFPEEGAWACFDAKHEASLGEAITGVIGRSWDPSDTDSQHIQQITSTVLAAYSGALGHSAGSKVAGLDGERIAARVTKVPRRRRGPVLAPGGWIHADLHVHTEFSKDCSSPVDEVLATAREVGLGAVAIADHNQIEGAFLAKELAGDDLTVIVAEEVMTQHGEVIGLFLKELIPKGLTFDETLSLIKEQDGIVYIPHPFDRLRTTPSYRSMVDNLHRIDVIETYNARNYLPQFNLVAERFAAKYNVAAGAGSDAHVLPGLGTAMLRMPRFHGPDEFMTALREADIVTRRKSLFYLQSLKLVRTTLDHVLPSP
jgi:glycosyltransferase involved in cell wall biosynthesis